MKITLDARLWRSSGIGVYIQNFTRLIAPHLTDIEWTILGQREDLKAISELPFQKCVIEASSQPYSVKEQLQLCIKTPPKQDFVWSPHWNVNLFSNQPMLVTIHDMFHSHVGILSTRKQFYGSKPYFKKILRDQPKILTVSEFSASEIRMFGLRDVTVIPNFIGDDWVTDFEQPIAPRPYFVFISNIKPHKNLRTALLAFERIINSHSEVDFVIIGRYTDMLTLDSEALDLARRLNPRVRLAGSIPLGELKAILTRAMAVVCPSLYEGFGLPVLEAMKAGIPVLASKIPAHEEVGGEAVLYFKPNSVDDCTLKMREIIENNLLRSTLSQLGVSRASVFHVESARQRFAQFFESMKIDRRDCNKVHNRRDRRSRCLIAMATFNRQDLLMLSLNSIVKADMPQNFELHIFDDASTGIDWEEIRRGYPVIQSLHFAEKNLGADRNILRMLKYFADSEFESILLLDGDCLVSNDLFQFLNGLSEERDVIWTAYRSRFHSEKTIGRNDISIVEKLSAGALGLFLRKSQVEWLLDTDLPMRFTDWAIVLRFRKYGGRILAPVRSRIEHIGWHGSNNRIGYPDRSHNFEASNDGDRDLLLRLENSMRVRQGIQAKLIEIYKTSINSVVRFKIRKFLQRFHLNQLLI